MKKLDNILDVLFDNLWLIALIFFAGIFLIVIYHKNSKIEHYKHLKNNEVLVCGKTDTQVLKKGSEYTINEDIGVVYIPTVKRQIPLNECFIDKRSK